MMHSNTLISLLALATAANAGPMIGGGAGSKSSIDNMKDKIKTVVVMVMENRSLDNLLGGLRIPGLDNPINNGPFCNPLNLTNPSEGWACTEPKDFDSVVDDPDHSISGNNIEFYGTFMPNNEMIADGHLKPTLKGFADEQIRIYGGSANKSTLAKQVMHYYSEEEIPVLAALSREFTVMGQWHSDIPGVILFSCRSNFQSTNFVTSSLPTRTVWP